MQLYKAYLMEWLWTEALIVAGVLIGLFINIITGGKKPDFNDRSTVYLSIIVVILIIITPFVQKKVDSLKEAGLNKTLSQDSVAPDDSHKVPVQSDDSLLVRKMDSIGAKQVKPGGKATPENSAKHITPDDTFINRPPKEPAHNGSGLKDTKRTESEKVKPDIKNDRPVHERLMDTLYRSFNVNNTTFTGLEILAGDTVLVNAGGTINLGAFYGSSTPYGIEKLTSFLYNKVNTFRHGALLIKIGEQASWAYCGILFKKQAHYSGILMLDINDKQVSDNVGEYTVDVKVLRKRN